VHDEGAIVQKRVRHHGDERFVPPQRSQACDLLLVQQCAQGVGLGGVHDGTITAGSDQRVVYFTARKPDFPSRTGKDFMAGQITALGYTSVNPSQVS